MSFLKNVLITGASEGIGRSLAEVFAKHNHELILVARNRQKLNELAMYLNAKYAVTCHVYPTDLSVVDSAEMLFSQLTKDKIPIDILVNNAGMMQIEKLYLADTEKLNQLLQLNIQSLVNMTRQFVPPMVARQAGKVLNVGSIASFMPTPNFSAYGASKAFVLSFSEGISEELNGTGVTVTCVCPGITQTNMLHQAQGVEKYIPRFLKAHPDSLASEAYNALMKGEVVFLDKLANKLLVQWATHYPRWMVRKVNGLFSKFS
ncbi:SDR family oxidoreductase [Aliiglaciecola sp. LCG003]|uniref:SDR family NAD(P)-dependent oxidoreductase n=1 Tax=Aliiglaciecola sp. LCG003 TaxID=3053655 RepID=UPI0025738F64|nr:SDR family oxidoreductase [Aliiglaciecola sp. LCG003]WJG09185.1 SDR family oxidoreductase [Aliiglaciecola sp. LCG003]